MFIEKFTQQEKLALIRIYGHQMLALKTLINNSLTTFESLNTLKKKGFLDDDVSDALARNIKQKMMESSEL